MKQETTASSSFDVEEPALRLEDQQHADKARRRSPSSAASQPARRAAAWKAARSMMGVAEKIACECARPITRKAGDGHAPPERQAERRGMTCRSGPLGAGGGGDAAPHLRGQKRW